MMPFSVVIAMIRTTMLFTVASIPVSVVAFGMVMVVCMGSRIVITRRIGSRMIVSA